jgi:hypothetical protein
MPAVCLLFRGGDVIPMGLCMLALTGCVDVGPSKCLKHYEPLQVGSRQERHQNSGAIELFRKRPCDQHALLALSFYAMEIRQFSSFEDASVNLKRVPIRLFSTKIRYDTRPQTGVSDQQAYPITAILGRKGTFPLVKAGGS